MNGECLFESWKLLSLHVLFLSAVNETLQRMRLDYVRTPTNKNQPT